jgi:type IV pilus assembly protein PilB
MQLIDQKEPEKLGEYLVSKDLITQQQLEHALTLAKERNFRLGRMLVELKYINGRQLMESLLERLRTSELGKRKKLGEILLASGIINEEQLKHALEVQHDRKQRIGEVLVSLGYVTKEQIVDALATKLQLNFVLCDDYILDDEIKKLVPKEMAKKYSVFPVGIKNGKLILAMEDPLDSNAIDEISFYTRLRLSPVISYDWSIEMAIDKNYQETKETYEKNGEHMFDALEAELQAAKDLEFSQKDKVESIGVDVETLYLKSNAPKIVKLVAMLITDAAQKRASDIHIEPRAKYVQVRFRIDGELQNIFKYQKEMHDSVVSRIKIISQLDITNRRTSQDGDASVIMKGRTIDMRISTLPLIYGEKVVIRLLDQSRGLVPLYELEMPEPIAKAIKDMFRLPQGMFIVTGPTGSGKTTTLYACLNHLRSDARNVISIEDPVEYKLEGISQTAVNEAVGRTFASILRSVLRQDPDIVMVGEIRDLETAEIAIKAALTGHLVLSTLHTNNTVATIVRLIDIGVPSYLVSSSVTGILSQRLVRRICKHCKVEADVEDEIKFFLDDFGVKDINKFYRGAGCSKCMNTGYLGRMAVYEYLSMSRKLKIALSGRTDEQELLTTARSEGLKFLYEDAINKVKAGLTTIEEVMSKVPFDYSLKEI